MCTIFQHITHICLLYVLECRIHFGMYGKYNTFTAMPWLQSVLPQTSFNTNKTNMRYQHAYLDILKVPVFIWQILVSFLRLEQWPIGSSVILVGQWTLSKWDKNAMDFLGHSAYLDSRWKLLHHGQLWVSMWAYI